MLNISNIVWSSGECVSSFFLHLPRRLYWKWRRWNSLGRWSGGRTSFILFKGFGLASLHVLEFVVKLVIIQHMFGSFLLLLLLYYAHIWFWVCKILQKLQHVFVCLFVCLYYVLEYVNCNMFGLTVSLTESEWLIHVWFFFCIFGYKVHM